MIAWILQGDTSVKCIYSTWSWFNHNAPAVDSMPRDCLKDLTRLLHFFDDQKLDDNNFEWDKVFDFPKHDHDHDDYAATHRVKFGLIEDAYMKQQQECVKIGKQVTADESCLAGWYHSPCTIGPDPKPIRTGATLHSLAVTCNMWEDTVLYYAQTYAYSGKHDGDL